MKQAYDILKHTALFDGISEEEAVAVTKCLGAVIQEYKKGQMINRVGETTAMLSVVLLGVVHIIKEDFWGNRSIIFEANEGQLFGETYALMPEMPMGISAVAVENCKILSLNARRVLTMCSSNCEYHSRLVRNLLTVTAQKNFMLVQKLEHMTQRTTRDKLLSYLSTESQRLKSPSFEIPFNRQQLADYLSVDRSAMSNELCKLRDEGLLNFAKNKFQLL